MRGQVVQRSKGSWTIILYLGRDPVSGRKRYRQHTLRGTRRDAERERVRLLRARDTGTYLEPSRQTTGEYLESWLRDYASVHVASTTYDRYANIVRLRLIPAIGHVPLIRLSPAEIKAHYSDALRKNDGKRALSTTTVLQHHRVLRHALKHAVTEGLIITNPADRVVAPRKLRREMSVLDESQTTELLELSKDTRLYLPILIAVAGGLRRGEILGLRWKDLDLKAQSISVQQTLEATHRGLELKPPKTPKSRRLVPMPRFAIEALREHKRIQSEQRLLLGSAYQNHDLVCAGPDGKPWNPDSLTPAFAQLIRKSKLPRIRFHDLRHGHATLLLRQGVHPKIVSERLGHATVGLTLDTYSHVLPGMQDQAVLAIDEALGSSTAR